MMANEEGSIAKHPNKLTIRIPMYYACMCRSLCKNYFSSEYLRITAPPLLSNFLSKKKHSKEGKRAKWSSFHFFLALTLFLFYIHQTIWLYAFPVTVNSAHFIFQSKKLNVASSSWLWLGLRAWRGRGVVWHSMTWSLELNILLFLLLSFFFFLN